MIRSLTTGSELTLSDMFIENGEIKSDLLNSDDGQHNYPAINYILRLRLGARAVYAPVR